MSESVVFVHLLSCLLFVFRELLEESSCDRPNGAVAAVPKLLRSIIDHNPNVFVSPSKPGVNSMFSRLVC